MKEEKSPRIIYIVLFLFFNVIVTLFIHDVTIPYIIENRLKRLNLMKYDSKTDNFVMKDSVLLNSGDLNYIKYGTTNY